jgi:hypothetical protein
MTLAIEKPRRLFWLTVAAPGRVPFWYLQAEKTF